MKKSKSTQIPLAFFLNNAKALGGKGTLKEGDLNELAKATRRVFTLMSDGRWHTADAIIAASQQREGLRRMRELRRWFEVERRRVGESRNWHYRLSKIES